MLTTAEIAETITITTIMVRKRATGRAITTEMAITTDVAIEIIIIVRKETIVFTGVYIVMHLVIATGHIDTDAMIAGNKKINFKNELYSKRKEIIKWFELNHLEDFDLYVFSNAATKLVSTFVGGLYLIYAY